MTTLTGLIGYPTEHSKSPAIHGHWIAEYGLNAEYKLFTTPPNRVRQVVHRLREKDARGFNVTVPHKQTVMEFLDEIDASAHRIGAVNTVTFEKGKAIGSNTDAYGFITNLSEGLGELTPYLENIVLLGAGGATRAALVALMDAGAKTITLTNRTPEKSQELAAEFAAENAATKIITASWEERENRLREATLLINTTSLGMAHQPPLSLDISALPAHAAVHDIVYAPLETPLLQQARARGLNTVDGLGMLLYQAQKSFALWHGIAPQVTPSLRAQIL